MKPFIDGAVWSIDSVPLHVNPGSEAEHNNHEYYRVKDIFQYSSLSPLRNDQPGVFIPEAELNLDPLMKDWVQDNKKRIIDNHLPVVHRIQGRWTLSLRLVNRL
jgi:hypothetical protein